MKLKFLIILLLSFTTIQKASAWTWGDTGSKIPKDPGSIVNCSNAESVMKTGLELIARGIDGHNNVMINQGRMLVQQANILFVICGGYWNGGK